MDNLNEKKLVTTLVVTLAQMSTVEQLLVEVEKAIAAYRADPSDQNFTSISKACMVLNTKFLLRDDKSSGPLINRMNATMELEHMVNSKKPKDN